MRTAPAPHGTGRGAIRRQHRRRGDTINDTTRAVAVLHNLKIDCARN
ncbi:hypothetical protein NLX86_29285 [Streptomyces sp. A3M-1-3]|nr:hypothetical protein [Streptomyces sp. A3M-1-3]MCP3822030.1 hypothetical protein [Streptomyces sp. A3M-1-3]